MGKRIIQIPSTDGCVYLYDIDTKEIRKLCDIFEAKSIPADVMDILKDVNLPITLKKDTK